MRPGAVEALAELTGVDEGGLECWLRGAPERAATCPLPDACEALLLATFAAALEVSRVCHSRHEARCGLPPGSGKLLDVTGNGAHLVDMLQSEGGTGSSGVLPVTVLAHKA